MNLDYCDQEMASVSSLLLMCLGMNWSLLLQQPVNRYYMVKVVFNTQPTRLIKQMIITVLIFLQIEQTRYERFTSCRVAYLASSSDIA